MEDRTALERQRVMIGFIHLLANSLPGPEYGMMGGAAYRALMQRDRARAMSVYWRELLQRGHFAAASGILRSSRWLRGIEWADAAPNYHVYCASMRGFIESCADLGTALYAFPKIVAEHISDLLALLTERAGERVIVSEQLEEMLIHYSHGRKLGKNDGPASHRAKRSQEYLEYLKVAGGEDVAEAWGELCEVTHPALASLVSLIDWRGTGEPLLGPGRWALRGDGDKDAIEAFKARHPHLMGHLLQQGLNPCLLTLAVLDLLEVPSLQTPAIRSAGLESVGRWREWRDRVTAAVASTKD